MSRLTKKIKDNLYYPIALGDSYELTNSKIQDKLGQHEDIEDELGVDLITLFKAIHNGVWAKNSKQGIHFISLIDWACEVSKMRNIDGTTYLKPLYQFNVWEGNNEDRDKFTYYLKDYGKTWALTKEELE